MNMTEELEKLQQLHQSGALSDEEYAQAKARLLNQPPAYVGSPVPPIQSPQWVEQQTRQWAMFIHLAQFAGCIVPLAGLILPIVLWQIKKAELPGVDVHGKNVTNWMISTVIYFVICIPFFCIAIGFVMMGALCVVNIIFIIIGAVKANNGEVWRYPMTISFIK